MAIHLSKFRILDMVAFEVKWLKFSKNELKNIPQYCFKKVIIEYDEYDIKRWTLIKLCDFSENY